MARLPIAPVSPRPLIAVVLIGAGVLLAPSPAAGAGSRNTVVHSSRGSDSYVLARGQQFMSTSVSIHDVEFLRRRLDGDFLWVRRGGKELVIRDSGAISEAEKLFEPLRRFDPERAALTERADRLASEESVLDAEEEGIEGELERFEERDVEKDAAARAALERRRETLRPKRRALEARTRDLDAAERELDRRSDAAEEEAEAALWSFIDRAIERGMARPLTPKR